MWVSTLGGLEERTLFSSSKECRSWLRRLSRHMWRSWTTSGGSSKPSLYAVRPWRYCAVKAHVYFKNFDLSYSSVCLLLFISSVHRTSLTGEQNGTEKGQKYNVTCNSTTTQLNFGELLARIFQWSLQDWMGHFSCENDLFIRATMRFMLAKIKNTDVTTGGIW